MDEPFCFATVYFGAFRESRAPRRNGAGPASEKRGRCGRLSPEPLAETPHLRFRASPTSELLSPDESSPWSKRRETTSRRAVPERKNAGLPFRPSSCTAPGAQAGGGGILGSTPLELVPLVVHLGKGKPSSLCKVPIIPTPQKRKCAFDTARHVKMYASSSARRGGRFAFSARRITAHLGFRRGHS